jgi:prepilin-type processing-associated H-X9-DG protein
MRHRSGMNLLELLVVVVIVVLIILIMLPAVAPKHTSARRAVCMTNLKSQGTMFSIYTVANSVRFPTTSVPLSSLCQQGADARDAILAAIPPGTTIPPKVFYCPSNTAQDPATLWTSAKVSTWGYVWLNDRGPGGAALPAVFPARKAPLQYLSTLEVPHPSEVMLALDTIVTDTDTAPLNYSPMATAVPFGTNHLPAAATNSANALFADGRVEALKFDPKTATAVKQPGGGFFWFPAQ